MKNLRTAQFMIAAAMAVAPALVFAQAKWNMPTAYAEGNFHTQNIKQFAAEVKEATGSRVDIVVHSGASLYKMPEIKRAVQTGQVQLGETLVSSLANEDPMFEASAVPFLANSFTQARNILEIARPFIEKRLTRDGLRLLYAAPWPTVGVFLKAKGDIKGQKIRTYDRSTSKLIELLGGIPTTVQAAEVPQAFATGIVGGMVTSSTTAHDTKAWEYVKVYYDMKASFPMNMVFVNERAFRALGQGDQKAILEAAGRAESRGWQRAEKLQEEMDAKIKHNGIEFIAITPAMQSDLIKAGGVIAQEWAARAGADGVELLKKIGR